MIRHWVTTDEGARPRMMRASSQPTFSQHGIPDTLTQSRGRGTRNRTFKSDAIEAEASCCATLRVNGTGSRAVSWFEGAHVVRRCARFSKSAHLGNPRGFLRRCAPLSKMRTENCAPSDRTRARVCERPASALERRKNGQAWAEFRQAESRNRDLLRDLFQARRLPATVLASNRRPSCARRAWPRILDADVKFAIERTH
jgi:hypothetical protein